MTVAECRRRVSRQEYLIWRAEYAITPWGEEQMDRRFALIATVIANGNGGKEHGGTFEPQEFLDWLQGTPEKEQSPLEIKAVFARMRGLTSGDGGQRSHRSEGEHRESGI